MTSPETVAQMASALAFIVERHRPDTFNAAQQGLTCQACSQLAGIPVAWPCDDRQAVGRLKSRTWPKPGLQTRRRRPLARGKPRGDAEVAEADGPGYVILNLSSRLRGIAALAIHVGTYPGNAGLDDWRACAPEQKTPERTRPSRWPAPWQ